MVLPVITMMWGAVVVCDNCRNGGVCDLRSDCCVTVVDRTAIVRGVERMSAQNHTNRRNRCDHIRVMNGWDNHN